jgi:hypothetical protein
MANERKLGSSALINRWPYFRPVTFLSYVHELPVMFIGYKHIIVDFWPTNISMFPIVTTTHLSGTGRVSGCV